MLLPILIFDIALVAWSLHLVQQAVQQRESSLMLAGTLVGLAAASTLVVYVLMDRCLIYLTHASVPLNF